MARASDRLSSDSGGDRTSWNGKGAGGESGLEEGCGRMASSGRCGVPRVGVEQVGVE